MKLHFTIPFPDLFDRILAPLVLFYRKKRYGKPYRLIRLTDGYYAKVSQQDFYNLSKYDWYAREKSGCIHAVRFNNFCDTGPGILAMHRVIMNAPKGTLVDHQNRDGLDNLRENLRFATRSQNSQNIRKLRKASSKYQGVSFNKKLAKWIAQISIVGNHIYLGLFESEIDAARAYDKAALKFYGQGARLNFPETAYNS
jgi:hypothetical protein